MPNAESEFLNIRRHLTNWVTEVAMANANGYFDINRVSEGTALTLLNLVFDLQLKDLNRLKINFPGIDLGDHKKGLIAFQITSQTNNSKILSSLETFIENNYVHSFPKGIRFLIINDKKTRRNSSSKFVKYTDIFDAKNDILYSSDLLGLIKDIYYKDQERFVKIGQFLEQEFGEKSEPADNKKPLINFNTPADKFAFYKRILLGNHQQLTQNFIPFQCRVDNEEEYTLDLIQDRIFVERGAIILGPSGCGKSIYAKRTALNFLNRGISVILEAKYYESSLTALLDKEASACGFKSASDLFETATELNQPVLLLVDGFNECLADKKVKLLAELEALQSAHRPKIVMTSQLNDVAFAGLNLLQVQVDYPSAEIKKAIASTYSGKLANSKLDPLLTAITTSLEAKMAGEIANEQIDLLSRFTLFESFINQKLGPARREGFLLLAHLARLMSAKIAFSISQRELDEILRTNNIPEPIYTSCIEAKILEENRGKVSFGHELFLNFFVAESVVRFAEDVSAIIGQIKAPKNYDKALLIIGSITDTEALDQVLASLTDINLLNAVSSGEAGDYCKKWIIREVGNILRQIEQEINQLQYQIDDQAISKVSFVAGTLTEWTSEQYAKIAILPYMLNQGDYLTEFFEMVAKMDQKVKQAIQALWEEGQQKNINVRYGTFSASYVGISNYNPAMTTIFSNLHSGFVTFNNTLAVTDEMIQQLLIKKSLTRGQFYFLLTLLRWDEKIQHLYPYSINVLKNHWKTTPYHLLSEILDKASYLHRTDEQREELIEALNVIHSQTRDIWLSTNIFDALGSLGALEQDATEYIRVVADEIDTLLQEPDSEVNFGKAISLYCCQFDHPYDFAYQAAIGDLGSEKKQILYEMALKGLDSPFFASFLLTEAAKELGDRICPLIIKWAAKPVVESTLPQDSLRVFLLSHLILAKYNYPLESRFANAENKADQSLLAAAELYYWFNRTDLDQSQAKTFSKEAQIILFAPDNTYLIDTLSELRHTIAQSSLMRNFEGFSLTFIDDCFDQVIVAAARKAIQHPELQQRFEGISYGNESPHQAIQLLERHGSLIDIDVLRNLSEHPNYGQSAVKAIKSLILKK